MADNTKPLWQSWLRRPYTTDKMLHTIDLSKAKKETDNYLPCGAGCECEDCVPASRTMTFQVTKNRPAPEHIPNIVFPDLRWDAPTQYDKILGKVINIVHDAVIVEIPTSELKPTPPPVNHEMVSRARRWADMGGDDD